MREPILSLISKSHPTYQRIVDTFGVDLESEIQSVLSELEKDALIDKLKDAYYLTSDLNMVAATITSIKERFAFATVSEDEDLYISINNLKTAFLGDKVLLRCISDPWVEKQEYEDNVRKLSIIVALAIVSLIIALIVIIKLYSDIKNIKNDNYLV